MATHSLFAGNLGKYVTLHCTWKQLWIYGQRAVGDHEVRYLLTYSSINFTARAIHLSRDTLECRSNFVLSA